MPAHRYFLGVFDLNAWYQAQMPSRVAVDEGVKCSYLSICDMDDVIAVAAAEGPEGGLASYIVNVHVNPASLTKYQASLYYTF